MRRNVVLPVLWVLIKASWFSGVHSTGKPAASDDSKEMESESCGLCVADFKSPVATLTFGVYKQVPEELFAEAIRVIFVTSYPAALQGGISTGSSRSRLKGYGKARTKWGETHWLLLSIYDNMWVKIPPKCSNFNQNGLKLLYSREHGVGERRRIGVEQHDVTAPYHNE